ncbi:MAG: DmsE family decaheme c-type cytochrome [Deltaproteobacteria bacterium]|nr:DmsE family decaheme c-type cytochrome [Deltaproteobacteria bacterium]
MMNNARHLFHMNKPCWLVLALLGCAVWLLIGCKPGVFFEGERLLRVPVIEDAFYVGTDSCVHCHNDVYRQYKGTIHSRLESFELKGLERGCETCHGPGSKHVASKGLVEDIISFSRLQAAESSEICLQCHRGAPTMDWHANVHVLNGVGCNECHKSHKITAPKMVYLGDPEICFTCHQEKMAQHQLPSHHPIKEQKMKCSSCHNNHGSENNNLNRETLNAVCSSCHAEYEGPFVYDHEPVVEDCSICHDPHGTIADSLLKQNEPFLCLRCHRGHRENPETGAHPSSAALMSACTQCHSRVHGTDLPAQLNRNGLTR